MKPPPLSQNEADAPPNYNAPMEEFTGQTDRKEAEAFSPREVELREREVKAKEREVSVKEAEQKIAARWNPVLWGLVGALLGGAYGVVGSVYVALKQSQSNQQVAQERAEADYKLQRQKIQGDFILEAIRTGSPEKARKNLIFLIDTGLVEDPGKKIQTFLEKREAPALPPLGAPTPYQPPFGSPVEYEVQVVDKDGKPMPEANISCNSTGTPHETTGPNGEYICMIPNGSRTVKVTAQAGEYWFSEPVPVTRHVIKLSRRRGPATDLSK